ncbi:DUF4132 domain-containing protein [Virgisporangium ochraceum]|uniref:DUF4132 domain-containing protein n=1 Tax=Virgisporangium ochraceum TaxID=65505 RepID=A0A8J4ECX3_9ACTN|nr:DUF4132 domain-containing protein [Virgisporangium ochraceum]GIJ70930.1 hypothetical protein Voc01_058470 [Virgisporangium ochraceum]
MTWAWPKGWLDQVLPRRSGGGRLGGVPVPPRLDVDGGRHLFTAAVENLRPHLEAPDPVPDLNAAALRYLDGDPSPLGLAALLAPRLTGDETWSALADVVFSVHGPAFAARTVAELAGLTGRCYGRFFSLERFTGWTGWDPRADWSGVARLMRVRLATVSDADHVRVVAALAPYRAGPFAQRALTSYLVPDQVPWVAADCADAASSGALPDALLLFGAAATVEQFTQVAAVARAGAGPTTVGGVATLLDVLGTDAVPVLESWVAHRHTRDTLEPVWTALSVLPSDAALDALVTREPSRYATAFVRRVMTREPERAMAALARAGGVDLLRDHVVTRPDVAERVLPGLPDAAAARIRAHLSPAGTDDGRVPVDELPPLLRRPPWTLKRRARPVVVEGLVAAPEVSMVWAPGEPAPDPRQRLRSGAKPVTPDEVESLLAGETCCDEHRLRNLALWPDDVLRPVAHRIPVPVNRDSWGTSDTQWLLAVRFGADALPAVLAPAREAPRFNSAPLLPYGATEVAVLMAGLLRLASMKALAGEWFTRHPGVAARALVPPALGAAGPARRQAEKALRLLVAEGFEGEVRAAAAGYGQPAADGIDTLLRTDPLHLLPGRVPALPAWLDPRLLPPLRVPDGRALPTDAVIHVRTALALSTVDEPYAGVDVVRGTCDPASLEAFAWAMADRWADAGYPARERWVYTALGLVGGDDTVERLVPQLERWQSSGAQARAVLGLDILGAIGTDRALMHLDRFARKAKTWSLRSGARARIEAVAEARGLTPEQLADRLVPDFDLDRDGRMTLDYGPRRFVVGFDEQLRPYTADAHGARLRTVPKPAAKDDPERAPAAYSRFAALKRSVRTVAAEQVRRFEKAMVWRRRWPGAELATLFVAHPLLQHLVRRLVWITDDGHAFRIAEDRTYADVDDDRYAPADDALVGVAHPVELGATVKAWSEVFADYQILQPFPQLGRETDTSAEPLDRFVGRTTTGGRALGLRSRGWELDDPDRGHSFRLALPGQTSVSVWFDPGMEFLGGFDPAAPQTAARIDVRSGVDEIAFERLHPVSRSEVLRDLTHVLAQGSRR